MVRRKIVFLGFDLEMAIAQCVTAKNGLWFQMSADAILRMFGLLDGTRD